MKLPLSFCKQIMQVNMNSIKLNNLITCNTIYSSKSQGQSHFFFILPLFTFSRVPLHPKKSRENINYHKRCMLRFTHTHANNNHFWGGGGVGQSLLLRGISCSEPTLSCKHKYESVNSFWASFSPFHSIFNEKCYQY